MKKDHQPDKDQYLQDNLEGLEEKISDHQRAMYSKKYLMYKEGVFAFGLDDYSDVLKLLENKKVKYSYKINKTKLAKSSSN